MKKYFRFKNNVGGRKNAQEQNSSGLPFFMVPFHNEQTFINYLNRKQLVFTLLFLIATKFSFAQTFPPNFNLVSNGSFEFSKYDYSSANDTSFEKSKTCWIGSNKYGAPFMIKYESNNHIARAHSGVATLWMQSSYPHIEYPPLTWIDTIGFSARPYPQTKLLEPLVAGLQYYFTMYIGVGKKMKGFSVGSQKLVANIGVYFSATKIGNYSTFGRLNFIPQINFTDWDVPIKDSLIYIKLSGMYVATGGEQYMTIGNFDYFNNLNFIFINDGSVGFVTFYPLIDDISLVRDTTQPMISLDKFSLGNDTTLCLGDTMRIGGEPHFFGYKWNTGDTSRFITINKPGTYWCSADFGCNTVTDTIVVSKAKMQNFLDIADFSLCSSEMPILEDIANMPRSYQYTWNNGSTDTSTLYYTFGKHWLRYYDPCSGETFIDTFILSEKAPNFNSFSLGKDTSNCLYGYFQDTITLQVPASSAAQIKWSNGSANNIIRVQEPGTYWVHVSNACYSVSDTINITGCAAGEASKVDIPNAFTPNGDGKNDVFRLRYLPQQVVSFSLKIYNRYGQMVSELRNRSDYWDGGNYDMGVYYYLFVYKDISGKEYTQKGDISLIR